MRVAQRLFLAVIPAVFGVLLVAALAYWGQYRHAAPEWVVVVAALTAAGSLVLAWQNTRYVARRVERLAGNRGLPISGVSHDELDSIEQVVDHLSSAVSAAQDDGKVRERAAADRIQEYAVLLDEAAAAVRRQLDDARLALHILADGSFGILNEHQAEMIEAARAGTDSAETEMARLHEIAQLDRQALTLRREAIRIGDVLQSLRPQLQAEGDKVGVSVLIDVEPGLPRVLGDRIRLQQALELLLRHVVRHAAPGNAPAIVATADGALIQITVRNSQPPTLDADVSLARRIIDAHGGRIDIASDGVNVTLPAQLIR